MEIRVQEADFDLGAELDALRAGRVDIGALASFTGIVRNDGGLIDMTLEHYPDMTERALAQIAAEAKSRFSLSAGLIIHRFGRLEPGAQIMMVAFDGASYMMDYLKSRAPFWKSERRSDGATWVEARAEDDAARDAWKAP